MDWSSVCSLMLCTFEISACKMQCKILHFTANKAGHGNWAAKLRRFRASVNPRYKGGIIDIMDGIPDFIDNFNTFINVIHRKIHLWNPKLKSLNSMPGNKQLIPSLPDKACLSGYISFDKRSNEFPVGMSTFQDAIIFRNCIAITEVELKNTNTQT